MALHSAMGLKDSARRGSFFGLSMATMYASFHSSGEEVPMKQLLISVSMCSLNVREVHFQNSEGTSSGPVALRFLIFRRMNSNSSIVNNCRFMSGGFGERGVRGIWEMLGGGGVVQRLLE